MKTAKTITIFRTRTFFSESQQGIDAYLAQSKQSIGGYWSSASSKGYGTGLTLDEINLLLPNILDIHPDDREFRKEVKAFYEALETKVPYDTGVTLNIGLTDNDKPLGKNNLPIVVMDYIRYRHAMGNPEVAGTKEKADGNPLIKYYVHDTTLVKKKNSDLRTKREDAMTSYLAISKDEDKVDNVMALYGEDVRNYNELNDKLEFLQAKIQKNSLEALGEFIDIVADKQLEHKAFVNKLVKVGVLRTIGTRYLLADSSAQVIGNDLEETMLKISEDSELHIVLKAQLQAKQKTASKAK